MSRRTSVPASTLTLMFAGQAWMVALTVLMPELVSAQASAVAPSLPSMLTATLALVPS